MCIRDSFLFLRGIASRETQMHPPSGISRSQFHIGQFGCLDRHKNSFGLDEVAEKQEFYTPQWLIFASFSSQQGGQSCSTCLTAWAQYLIIIGKRISNAIGQDYNLLGLKDLSIPLVVIIQNKREISPP